jgi:hypothetical protein
MSYFIFLQNVCCKRFPFLVNTLRIADIYVQTQEGSHVKRQVFLSNFNRNWNERAKFIKSAVLEVRQVAFGGEPFVFRLETNKLEYTRL